VSAATDDFRAVTTSSTAANLANRQDEVLKIGVYRVIVRDEAGKIPLRPVSFLYRKKDKNACIQPSSRLFREKPSMTENPHKYWI